MSVATLIIGKSGSGKSASLRNFKPEEVGLINVMGKPLPFKGRFRQLVTDDYASVVKAMRGAQTDVIVIDDAGYLITNQFMKGHASAGAGNGVFALYNSIGDNFWKLIIEAQHLGEGKRVYFLMHEEKNELGDVKPKTIGKLIDEKVCLEGMFTVCLRAVMRDGKRVFRTQTDGTDVAKSPMGMFASDEIDNDLKAVDAAICEYYGIKKKEVEKNEAV